MPIRYPHQSDPDPDTDDRRAHELAAHLLAITAELMFNSTLMDEVNAAIAEIDAPPANRKVAHAYTRQIANQRFYGKRSWSIAIAIPTGVVHINRAPPSTTTRYIPIIGTTCDDAPGVLSLVATDRDHADSILPYSNDIARVLSKYAPDVITIPVHTVELNILSKEQTDASPQATQGQGPASRHLSG